jgi:Mg-chelatase subunit ChlD
MIRMEAAQIPLLRFDGKCGQFSEADMKTTTKLLAPLLAPAAFFLSCNISNPTDSEPADSQNVFRIEGKYTNSAANANAAQTSPTDPKFAIELNTLPKEIKSVTVRAVRQAGHQIDIVFSDLRIFDWVGDKKINYEITALSFEEKVEGKWVSFTEFKHSQARKINNLGIVLVLDASNSLGSDFTEVKLDAKDFVNLVFQNTVDSARVGVVAFSTTINSMKIDLNGTGTESMKQKIFEFIDKDIKQDEFTALYDGMLAGIDMLADPLLKVDAKALVTFTDGRDNYSFRTNTADTVAARLKKNQIPSFTIGYKGRGELDAALLQRLAQASQGVFRLAEDKAKLKTIFHEIAVSVTDVYTVTYSRNDQVISASEPRPIRLNIFVRKKV